MASVLDFGARGDGKTDDTAALQHALQKGDGQLVFPRGNYLIQRPLVVPLDKEGRISISGQGGVARLIMAGPGPALHLVGTHNRSADPADFQERIWTSERMPTVQGLEVLGQHAEADGIRIDGTMQPTFHAVLIRRCRHGLHLLHRNRNVLVADCHIYDCTGVGILFDRLNLHQTNIAGSHISYCKQGGIAIRMSEIRNLQICGNDIEYNYDLKAETSADVLIDCREGTVREGTIVGNTIQAKKSPKGANIRLIGAGKDNPGTMGMFTITGNLLGSQETVLHLQACRGVVVSGNCIYNGYSNALVAEDCEHLVLSGNSIDHNPDYKGPSTDQVVLRGCRNVNLTGLLLQHTRPAEGEVSASVEVIDCENTSITGCQVLGARKQGIVIRDGSVIRVADCTIRPRQEDQTYQTAVRVEGRANRVMVNNNFLARGSGGELILPREAGNSSGNVTL
jgi:polygalacturonase